MEPASACTLLMPCSMPAALAFSHREATFFLRWNALKQDTRMRAKLGRTALPCHDPGTPTFGPPRRTSYLPVACIHIGAVSQLVARPGAFLP